MLVSDSRNCCLRPLAADAVAEEDERPSCSGGEEDDCGEDEGMLIRPSEQGQTRDETEAADGWLGK